MPITVKNIIGEISALSKTPNNKGLIVEATVPNDDTIPFPSARALPGYSSAAYSIKTVNSIEMQNLNTKTRISSMIDCEQKSQSSGFLLKDKIAAMIVEIANSTIPNNLRGVFSMK